jgi:hypothetical protein
LGELQDASRRNPEFTVLVDPHTDKVGTAASSKGLVGINSRVVLKGAFLYVAQPHELSNLGITQIDLKGDHP